ncbi:Rieske (2Fe-2S) protein [Paramagnetospirillum marisnigri]|uniref:Rieske (2Fe-2S) protein n=1 Tax=Paramagnetospirillum marisnigri TaxID=1285242 RepID=UPI000A4E35C5|nr:Rieske (2Fe-2S) protein [Paramagnetospirillum marisnigri]
MKTLCPLDSIPDPGAREFKVMLGGEKRRIFVVRQGDEVFGYVNSCPHVGAPLNIEDDAFLDIFKTSILCANHFALFEIETGLCVRGPCNGRRLEAVPLEVVDGEIRTLG